MKYQCRQSLRNFRQTPSVYRLSLALRYNLTVGCGAVADECNSCTSILHTHSHTHTHIHTHNMSYHLFVGLHVQLNVSIDKTFHVVQHAGICKLLVSHQRFFQRQLRAWIMCTDPHIIHWYSRQEGRRESGFFVLYVYSSETVKDQQYIVFQIVGEQSM